MMSINPDAHSTREIDLTHWGVEMARKGGVPAKRVFELFHANASHPASAQALDDARPRGLI
jgi:DNA polymerase (family X)